MNRRPPAAPGAAHRSPIRMRSRRFASISTGSVSASSPSNIPAGDYSNLAAGAGGNVLLHRADSSPGTAGHVALAALSAQGARGERRSSRAFVPIQLSADKKKLLYQAGGGANRWGIVATERPAKVGDGALNVAQLEMRVDPRAEWAEIFRETWRIQRDFFYDAKMHGADWQAVYDEVHAAPRVRGPSRRPRLPHRA